MSTKLSVSAALLVAVIGLGGQTAHADEATNVDTKIEVKADDKTSDKAITEMAKLVIKGIDADGKTRIPTGAERVVYLEKQGFDADAVQAKVNELHFVAPVVIAVPEVQVAQAAPSQEVYVEPAQEAYVAPTQESYVGNGSSAKEWIAQKESSGSYTASNGQYYGRYQLNPSLYAGYDTTPAGQEAAADAYVAGRYGTWEQAQAFWIANGWY